MDTEDFVDSIFAGNDSEEKNDTGQQTPQVPTEMSAPQDPPADTPPVQTGGEKEEEEEDPREKRIADLEKETETLSKRFHDTQASFHKISQENAELKKQLDELQNRKDNPWSFLNEDEDEDEDEDTNEDENAKASQNSDIDRKIEEISDRVAQAEKNISYSQWNKDAEPVRNEHSDFDEKLTYLCDLIDKDAAVKAAWDSMEDNSPKKAYEFAVKMQKILEPDQVSNATPPPANREPTKPKELTGKAALDYINSALSDSSIKTDNYSESYVDSLFN